ncbi:MAG: hypothetical protein ACI9LV_000967 [Candidatus Nanohaloarchaea archaeon]
MTDPETAKVKKYFSEKLSGKINEQELLDLLLLVIGEKPGALVMGADRSTVKLLQNFAEDFDLKIKTVKGGKRSLLDKLLGKDTRFQKDGVFITDDRKRFETLENSTGNFMGFSDRAVGKFLGYPEKSRNYYERKSGGELAGADIEDEISALEEEGETDSSDRKYLHLVSYRPMTDRESILKAIDRGKKRAQKLREMDSNFNISVGADYLNRIETRNQSSSETS